MVFENGAHAGAGLRVFGLDRPGGHRLAVTEWGRVDGLPVVVLHGGPGSGCRAAMTRFFDAGVHRVILPDQRGSGQSRPSGAVEGNDTAALVDDLEALRLTLEVDQWLVFGGSWGATLALCYARRYRERVMAMVLRGVFSGRRRDRSWVFGHDGAARLLPQAYESFRQWLPAAARYRDPAVGYWGLLRDESPAVRERAAAAWSRWEDQVAFWGRAKDDSGASVERALIACHYAINDFFLDPEIGAFPDDSDALAGIPGAIVHGCRDLVCPVYQAVTLAAYWPGAALRLVEEGAHLDADPAIEAALKEAVSTVTDELLR